MSPAVTRGLIAAGLVLVLGVVGGLTARKERIRSGGEVVFLELAPVDPRSLMQGDYMALRFHLAQEIESRRQAEQDGKPAWGERATGEGGVGWAAIAVDARGVARLAAPEVSTGLRIRYRVRSRQIWLGTNAFFFQEGEAHRYAGARFGEFRLDRESGEALLVGLRSAELEAL